MRKNLGNVLLIILVVTAVVAASVGGYFWWSSFVKTPEDKQNLQVSDSKPKEASPSADERVDWKIFRNQKIGYQMSYPAGWTVNGDTSIESDLDQRDQFSFGGNSQNIYVGATTNSKIISYLKNGAEDLPPVKTGTKINIAGIVWERYFHPDNDPGELADSNSTLVLLTNHTGKEYFIRLAPSDDLEVENDYDQILSTFKFIDVSNQRSDSVCNFDSKDLIFKTLGYYKCAGYNVLIPDNVIPGMPIYIVDDDGKEIMECGTVPGPTGNICPEKYYSADGCKKIDCSP